MKPTDDQLTEKKANSLSQASKLGLGSRAGRFERIQGWIDELNGRLSRRNDKAQRSQIQHALARLLVKSERWTAAREAYIALIDQQPDVERYRFEAGRLAEKMGERDRAVKLLQPLAEKRCFHQRAALNWYLRCLMHSGAFEQAGRGWWRLTQQLAEESKESKDAKAEAFAGLVVCALCADRPRVARRAAEQLKTMTSSHERRQLLAAQWQHAAGLYAIRRKQQMSASKAQINSKTTRQQGQEVVTQITRWAARKMDRAAKQHPMRADVRYHQAKLHQKLTHPAKTKDSINSALSINPKYKNARVLSKSLKLNPDDQKSSKRDAA